VLQRIAEPRFADWPPAHEPCREAVDALRADDRFADAMLAAAQASIDLYAGGRVLNLLVNDRARLVLATLTLHLHWAPLPGQTGAGLTTSRVREFASENGFCSAGRASALIALMRWGGYLVPDDRAADGRMRLLAPTEKLLALHRARWTRMLAAAGLVLPASSEAARRVGEPGFVPAFAVAQIRGFLTGFRLLQNAPEMGLFAERDCGALILFVLFAAEQGEGSEPVSVSSLARRFGVSRPHVAKLLRDGEAAGVISRKGQEIGLHPVGLTALERFFATLFLFNEACAKATLSALED
jgi:hypothetical protein